MHIHSLGIVHNDIKPRNIFLSLEKEELVAKIGDFGISRTANMEKATDDVGTPSYMAPELFDGDFPQPTIESDMYSLGCVLYHICNLEQPFKNTIAAVAKS